MNLDIESIFLWLKGITPHPPLQKNENSQFLKV